jgi:hypothetical protein
MNVMNVISAGAGTGLMHTLVSFNYAIKMSNFLVSEGRNVNLFFKWRCHESLLNLIDVNLTYFKGYYTLPLINIPDCYLYKKNTIDWSCLHNYTNVLLNTDSVCELEYDFLFNTVRPIPQICKQIINIVDNELDCGNYTAIHVRGGDQIRNKYNSDYEKFLKLHCERIDDIVLNTNNKILLCTDSQDIVMKYVDNKKIYSKSLVYDLHKENIVIPNDCAIHSKLPHIGERVDLSAIIDFYLLFFSKKLYADVNNSGYAQVATKLNKEFLNRKISVSDTLFNKDV